MARNAAQQRLPLRLVDDDWRIDDHTREVGRRGIAEARAALAAATRRAAEAAHPSSRGAGRAA
ncbi:MAG TPA: hypothetical protein VMU14_19155 [Acidimicrobiales bacterium]|nr:hypothetical protein [Acidimicrobiales bacterium]